MFLVSIWGLGALFGGLSPPKPARGDGTANSHRKFVARRLVA